MEMLIKIALMRGKLSSLNLLSLTGHLTRLERLSFWEMTVYHVSMTHGDTNTHRPPGSTSISQSQRHVFPSSRNADILTLGRKKVETQAAFSKGYPLYVPIAKIPNQTVNLQWHSQLWRGGKLLKRNTVASVMLLCAQMVLAQTLAVTMQFVCDWP